MSFLGPLGQFNLSNVLQRIEAHAKTGVLIVQQQERWVELYFRQGQLMCVGPVRSNSSLGDRLLQAGVISEQALQEAKLAIGSSDISETGMALTLIDLGYVNHDRLYVWAVRETARIIQVLLTWTTGEIYFEDELQPPPDRLLIALSVTSLLPSRVSTGPIHQPVHAAAATATLVQEKAEVALSSVSSIFTPLPPVANAADSGEPPTAYVPSQSLSNNSPISQTKAMLSLFSSDASLPISGKDSDTLNRSTLPPPRRVTTPIGPARIDTLFMTPQMVLVPVDLSPLCTQKLEFPLTPEQWRLLTQADGRTPLRSICQMLLMSPEQVRQIAGELIALRLITASLPYEAANEVFPFSQDSSDGYNAMSTVPPGVTPIPATNTVNNHPFYTPALSETDSKWGNGGNGASFFLGGGGWVLTSPSSPSLQPIYPLHVPPDAKVPVMQR